MPNLDPSVMAAVMTAMDAALKDAEKLVLDGWAIENDQATIYRPGVKDSARTIDPIVWGMMRAISVGISIRSKLDL